MLPETSLGEAGTGPTLGVGKSPSPERGAGAKAQR